MMLLLIDITIWLFIYGLFGDLYVVNTFAFPIIIVFNILVILDYFVIIICNLYFEYQNQ